MTPISSSFTPHSSPNPSISQSTPSSVPTGRRLVRFVNPQTVSQSPPGTPRLPTPQTPAPLSPRRDKTKLLPCEERISQSPPHKTTVSSAPSHSQPSSCILKKEDQEQQQPTINHTADFVKASVLLKQTETVPTTSTSTQSPKRLIDLACPGSKRLRLAPSPLKQLESRQIYHITHVSNLESICNQGLLCLQTMSSKKIPYQNIGYEDLKQKRLGKTVSVAEKGTLGDYVPFYFCTKSAMLCAVHNGSNPGYREGQQPIIYLVSTAERAAKLGRAILHTDRHACALDAKQYGGIEDLEEHVDFTIMTKELYGLSSDEQKLRRQAELLVHNEFPIDAIQEIVVQNIETEKKVSEIIQKFGHSAIVTVNRKYFF